jgi:hypothetical protein
MKPKQEAETSSFTLWLRHRFEADPRSRTEIATTAHVSAATLDNVLAGRYQAPRERIVRGLACALNADVKVALLLAGHGALDVPPPDPRGFGGFHDWLRAALAARQERAIHASRAMGLQPGHMDTILREGYVPERPMLDQIADYFGADRAAVRAFRQKQPSRVAAGKRVTAGRGEEWMASFNAAGRSAAAASMTPEKRHEIARLGGAATSRRGGKEHYQALSASALESRRQLAAERGSWFQSDETLAAGVAKRQAAGVPSRAGRTTLERHGPEHFQGIGSAAAAKKKNGIDRLCLFCGDPDRLIYQTPFYASVGGKQYHGECYKAWRRTLPMRERSEALGLVGWIWSRVKFSSDEALKARVAEQMRAQLEYLRQPVRRGRRPTLIRDKDLAIHAAMLQDDLGLTTREIGELAGWARYRDQRGNKTANRWAWEMVRLGRALTRREASHTVDEPPA